MSIVYNAKKASDLVVGGRHMREAWINGEKIWPEAEGWGDWFVVKYKAVSSIKIYIKQEIGKICEVDWGDGISETFTDLDDTYYSAIEHTYSSYEPKIVKFRGEFIGIRFNDNINNDCRELEAVLNIPSRFKPRQTYQMFLNCSALKTVPWIDLSENKDASYMFYGCSSMVQIPSMDFSNADYAIYLYAHCALLTEVQVLDLSRCNALEGIFMGCTLLKTVKMITKQNFNISGGISMFSYIFKGCENLESIDAEINCTATMTIGSMVRAENTFENCYKLQNIPFGDIGGIYAFNSCFKNCKSLNHLSLELENGRIFENMFEGCSNLIRLDLVLNYDDTITHTPFRQYYIRSMFKDNILLTFLNITTYCWYNGRATEYDGIEPNDYTTPTNKDNYPFERCQALTREAIPSRMQWMHDDYYKEEV